MLKKIKISALAALAFFTALASGCDNSRRIEHASIIETVSVTVEDGKKSYSLYKLTDAEKPDGVAISADSFEQACERAKKEYVPNISLSKLELLIIDKEIDLKEVKRDIDYISTQSSFSPVAYVTLCDKGAIKLADEKTSSHKLIEEQLSLTKRIYPNMNIDYLSIYNHFASIKKGDFYIPYISGDEELKCGAIKIKI